MMISEKCKKTVYQVFISWLLWSGVCMLLLSHRIVIGVTSPSKPLTTEDKNALMNLVNWKLEFYAVIAVIVLYGCFSIINDRFGKPEGQKGMKLMLNLLLSEFSTACLTIGSVLVAVGWNISQGSLVLAGLLTWGLWLLFKTE
jgi:hypothetical protein